MNQKRVGIIISYISLVLGMAVNLFITPLMISTLGDVDYSIYKVMQSFAGPLVIFHLGISTIVTRSVVKQQTASEYTEKDKQNTMAHALLASGAIAVLVMLVGFILYLLIPTVYGAAYEKQTIELGKTIFLIFVASTVFHMMTDAFSGCLIGHEKYAVSSTIQLSKNVFKIILTVVLLKLGMGAIGVVCVDLAISLGVFVFTAAYAMGTLRERPKFTHFDKKQIMEILLFGSAMLMQAVVNQVNNNVDTMILGAYVDEKAIITMYSSALAIYAIYNSLISVITNFFLPKATKLVLKNASGEALTDFVIAPGRFQAMIGVGCVCGFALFGYNFITIWIGERYSNAYWVTLMLIVPVTIPLVENTAIAILDATLKRIYRSTVLLVMAVINVALSLLLVSRLGFWGAAIGTVFSLIVGHGFMMNIYYAKTFKMQIGRMFLSIFKGILPAGLLASLLCLPLSLFLANTFWFFLLKVVSFIAAYAVFLRWFGMNREERVLIDHMLKKVLRRRSSGA